MQVTHKENRRLLRNTSQVSDFELVFGFLGRLFGGDESHAQFVGAQGQLAHDPFAVSLFVVLLALVGVFLALGQHHVDQPREFVGRSGDGARAKSILEHMRLKYAPSADWLVRSAAAASRSAWAARLAQRLVLPLKTLPPGILVPGHKPIQLAKCPSVGKRDMSAPVSLMTASAVLTSMPSMRVVTTRANLEVSTQAIQG